MNWYAAHIVMFVEFNDTVRERFPVWENIVLVEAATESEAFEKATSRGRAEEGDEGGSFRWGKKPARWVFAGVRKLTECAMVTKIPGDGAEISFNELELGSREAVTRFVRGKPVEATCKDRFSAPAPRSTITEAEPKRPKRKGA